MDQKYNVIEVIGEGGYGTVYRCTNKKTGEMVAIKKYLEQDCAPLRKILKREIEILKKIKHENIIELKDVILKDSYYYLVFEYGNKSLLEMIENSDSGLSPEKIKSFTFQMCKAVSYLHKNNIIYRDIKPENFLVAENNIIKLCDFDFIRYLNENKNEPMTEYVATRYYRAPEILLGSGHYGFPIDFWGIGCIMGEMADGDPVFPGDSLFEQLEVMIKLLGNLPESLIEMYNKNDKFNVKELLKIDKPETLDEKYKNVLDKVAINFLKKLLELDPDKRLNADNVFKDEYLSELYNEEKEKEKEKNNDSDYSYSNSKSSLNKSSDSSNLLDNNKSSSYDSSFEVSFSEEEKNNEKKNNVNNLEKINEVKEVKLKDNDINKTKNVTQNRNNLKRNYRSDLVDFSKNYFKSMAKKETQDKNKQNKNETKPAKPLETKISVQISSKSTNIKVNNFFSLSNKTVNSKFRNNIRQKNQNLNKKTKNQPGRKSKNEVPVKIVPKIKVSSPHHLNCKRYQLHSPNQIKHKNFETNNKNDNGKIKKVRTCYSKGRSLYKFKEAPVVNINLYCINEVNKAKNKNCFLPKIITPRRMMSNDSHTLNNKKLFLTYGINGI